MKFEEFCAIKKIDALSFEKSEKLYYADLKEIFEQISVSSFTQQKMFIINKIRRKHQLKNSI